MHPLIRALSLRYVPKRTPNGAHSTLMQIYLDSDILRFRHTLVQTYLDSDISLLRHPLATTPNMANFVHWMTTK